jgi:hypothetical protein
MSIRGHWAEWRRVLDDVSLGMCPQPTRHCRRLTSCATRRRTLGQLENDALAVVADVGLLPASDMHHVCLCRAELCWKSFGASKMAVMSSITERTGNPRNANSSGLISLDTDYWNCKITSQQT